MSKAKDTDNTLLELQLPQTVEQYLTPLTIIVTALLVSFAIILSFNNAGTWNKEILGKTTKTNSSISLGGASDGKLGTYTKYKNEICTEDGKPIVFMFSATWCPHCEWIEGEFTNWADQQDDLIVYKYEIDTNDDSLTPEIETKIPDEHMDVYRHFNPQGSIPTFVFGCQYSRIGNGYESTDDLEAEVEEFNILKDEILK